MTLPTELSISWYIKDKEIHFWTDAGRCLRPLYIVDKESQQPFMRRHHIEKLEDPENSGFVWQTLISKKLIEQLEQDRTRAERDRNARAAPCPGRVA